jgi:hypothetical protein
VLRNSALGQTPWFKLYHFVEEHSRLRPNGALLLALKFTKSVWPRCANTGRSPQLTPTTD